MTNKLDRWIEEKIQGSASPKKVKVAGRKKKSAQKASKKPTHGGSNKRRTKAKKQYSKQRKSANNTTHTKHTKRKSHSAHKKNNTHKKHQSSKKHNARSSRKRTPHKRAHKKPTKVRIIPLGGLDEVGKNMTVIEYGRDIILVDMGFQFPEEDMLGIDYVIPDISWLEERKKDIRGVILTHGHLDHIGGIPYILPRLNFPQLYGTKLTMGLIEKRVEEFGIKRDTVMNVIDPDEKLRLGPFNCSFFRVNHSIPDGVGIVINTPEGTIVHTGDFKFDYTPADQIQADYKKISALGKKKNVTVMFSDSTNAMKEGHTISEKAIGDTLDMLIKETPGRILIASFSSLIGRIQQILNSAKRWNRQVYVSGRSLINNISIAERLGYIKVPKGLIHDIYKAKKTPGKKSLILTTGSQGEALSALTRISLGQHKHVSIKPDDTVIISATPIIGNERAISTVIDNLTKKGARVINNKIMDVHTSGHGCREDLRMMIGMVKPKYFVPVHGQYHMRFAHKELAHEAGIRKSNAIMMNNGNILEMQKGKVRLSKDKVETNYILVDGLGMGNMGSRVLVERQALAENGVFVVTLKIRRKTKNLIGNPKIETRGFIYMTESDEILKEVQKKIKSKYNTLLQKHKKPGVKNIKDYVTSVIDKYTHKKLQRRPLIVPIVLEV